MRPFRPWSGGKILRVGQMDLFYSSGRKEPNQLFLMQVSALDHLIVGSKFIKDALVADVKIIAAHAAMVINNDTPSAGTQNTHPLCTRPIEIEPMHRLACRHHIHTMVRKARCPAVPSTQCR